MDENSSIYTKLLSYVTAAIKNPTYELECKVLGVDDRKTIDNVMSFLQVAEYKRNTVTSLDVTLQNRIRVTITGQDDINAYCNTRKFTSDIVSIKKTDLKDYPPMRVLDFQIEFKIKNEEEYVPSHTDLQSYPVFFRYKMRHSFTHPDVPFIRIDITAVKESKNSVEQIGRQPQKYEIEIELLPTKVLKTKPPAVLTRIFAVTNKMIQIRTQWSVLITNTERKQAISDYLNLFKANNGSLSYVFQNPKQYFMGPQPVTLERKNMIDTDNKTVNVFTILSEYSVTEKADGERMMMYINNEGRVSLINTRLDVYPIRLDQHIDEEYRNSVIDGEFITVDSLKNRTNMFMGFDVYFRNNVDLRAKSLQQRIESGIPVLKQVYERARLHPLAKCEMKHFAYSSKDKNIFDCIKEILDRKELGYEYHVDGLIFTPINLGVSQIYSSTPVDYSKTRGMSTWLRVFKWKPAEENTVDFLVEFGDNIASLYVGHNPDDEKTMGYIDYLRMAADKRKLQQRNSYEKKLFAITKIEVDRQGNPISVDKKRIENNSIIECKYIKENMDDEKWVPIRSRTDKTTLYHNTKQIAGTANDIRVAKNVLRSIDHPVTEQDLLNQVTYDTSIMDEYYEDKYYVETDTKRNDDLMLSMRDFHNIDIKEKLLIKKVAMLIEKKNKEKNKEPKRTLLFDIACGKGGDMRKWMQNQFHVVVGIDSVSANIDECYRRYLRAIKDHNVVDKSYHYLFAQLDATTKWSLDTVNMMESSDNKKILQTIFAPDTSSTGKDSTLSRFQGISNVGFQVISCQFAIHYFMRTNTTMQNFLHNLSMISKQGSYFIGTCLDAATVNTRFEEVNGNNLEGSNEDGVTVWNIKKSYDEYPTKADPYGKEIKVYIHSIGKEMSEYLVDYSILRTHLETIGFQPLPVQALRKVGLSSSTEMFNTVDSKLKSKMKSYESSYSSMNRWFIFKRVKQA